MVAQHYFIGINKIMLDTRVIFTRKKYCFYTVMIVVILIFFAKLQNFLFEPCPGFQFRCMQNYHIWQKTSTIHSF